MAQFRLEPVLLDHRTGEIVHYGRLRELSSEEIHEAEGEAVQVPFYTGSTVFRS